MTDSKLENYLFELEKNLKDVPPSARAQIVSEVNTQVCELQKNYPEKSISQIISDLGSAQKLANHYRLDRGIKTFKPNRNPILKWISITFIGSICIFFVFISLMIWKFTPIFKVDESTQRITILGGLIDVNGVSGKVKIGNEYSFIKNQYPNAFNGSMEISKEEFNEVVISFNTAILEVKTAEDRKFSWDCKLSTPPNDEFVNLEKDSVELKLEKSEGADCKLLIPQDINFTVEGKDGQVILNEPEFDTFVEVENGTVQIIPNPEIAYKYDFAVKNGSVPALKASQSKDAFEMKINVANGKIIAE